MTVHFPLRSETELRDLLDTMAPRCLGCAAVLPDDRDDRGQLVWKAHGTCRPYYGAGIRVDYDRWCEILLRATDEPMFRIWAAAESQLGVPSWAA